MKKLPFLSMLALLCGGCASSFKLPEVAGKSVTYSRKDTFGGTTITAKGVQVTATEILAEVVTWNTTYPQFSLVVTVEGFSQKREEAK